MIDERREDEVLRRYWYAAGFVGSLDDGPIALTILGDPVVVVRLDGVAVAAIDRCPHRGARLSSGQRVDHRAAQCLRCPYHGLHFDRSGAAVHLPAVPDDRLPAAFDLPLLPCVERHGVIWVSLVDEPIGEPPPWGAFDDEPIARFQLGPEPWLASAMRVIENFNDLAHRLPVQPPRSAASGSTQLPIERVRVAEDGGTIAHAVTITELDQSGGDGRVDDPVDAPEVLLDTDYSFVHSMPFSTEVRIRFDDDRTEWIQLTATPIDATSALVFQQSARNFDRVGDLDGWRGMQQVVNTEDRILVESLRPRRIGLDGSGTSELALPIDGFSLAYRRLWRDLLARFE